MNKDKKENQKDWLDSIITNLLVKNFYKKFTTLGEHKIYLKNMFQYLKKNLNMHWLKEKSFISKAQKKYHSLMKKFYQYKKNERLKKIQNKYPNLQITEAYYYLSLHNKFKIKDEDLELFDEMLDVLFAKIKYKKNQKEENKNDEKKLQEP